MDNYSIRVREWIYSLSGNKGVELQSKVNYFLENRYSTEKEAIAAAESLLLKYPALILVVSKDIAEVYTQPKVLVRMVDE